MDLTLKTPAPDFEGFPKIARLSREIVITEKIDGTNAQLFITEDKKLYAGSRKRWIYPGDDNFGFAQWAREHREELIEGLGPGRHFGEWWGQGIQRGYGLDHRRFSLFNTHKWTTERPACCHVVPILYTGPFKTGMITIVLQILEQHGSFAKIGYPDPEGIVIYHTAGNLLFKKTFKNDEKGKP